MLIKVIKFFVLLGNIYFLIYSVNSLRYIKYEYEYMFVVAFIIFFALNTSLIFVIYRKNKLK